MKLRKNILEKLKQNELPRRDNIVWKEENVFLIFSRQFRRGVLKIVGLFLAGLFCFLAATNGQKIDRKLSGWEEAASYLTNFAIMVASFFPLFGIIIICHRARRAFLDAELHARFLPHKIILIFDRPFKFGWPGVLLLLFFISCALVCIVNWIYNDQGIGLYLIFSAYVSPLIAFAIVVRDDWNFSETLISLNSFIEANPKQTFEWFADAIDVPSKVAVIYVQTYLSHNMDLIKKSITGQVLDYDEDVLIPVCEVLAARYPHYYDEFDSTGCEAWVQAIPLIDKVETKHSKMQYFKSILLNWKTIVLLILFLLIKFITIIGSFNYRKYGVKKGMKQFKYACMFIAFGLVPVAWIFSLWVLYTLYSDLITKAFRNKNFGDTRSATFRKYFFAFEWSVLIILAVALLFFWFACAIDVSDIVNADAGGAYSDRLQSQFVTYLWKYFWGSLVSSAQLGTECSSLAKRVQCMERKWDIGLEDLWIECLKAQSGITFTCSSGKQIRF